MEDWNEQKAKINVLKIKIEDTDIDERAALFAQIDKLEKDVLDLYEEALNEAMPTAFAIVKETARRFSEKRLYNLWNINLRIKI